ncbi:hypothetical protein ACF1BE_16425 [Streptomyces sp. NPDC014991]|uniref:hypothetical protein n=1 Tax=Streptomyces sp. NPDC014991 TaxID=3364935 RepID=UPI00370034EB
MRRGLVHVLAWLLATGAAVTLSWWGVHTVMAGTAYEPPRALPVAAADAATRRPESPAPKPPVPSTTRPSPSGTPSSGPPAAAPSRTPAPAASHSPTVAASAAGRVRSYDTDGGRAVFDLGTSGATLVSATPGAGWSMQVWKTTAWIRVEFARGADRVTVFCTWHDGPPRVDIGTY